jgi:hypothetical protein
MGGWMNQLWTEGILLEKNKKEYYVVIFNMYFTGGIMVVAMLNWLMG